MALWTVAALVVFAECGLGQPLLHESAPNVLCPDKQGSCPGDSTCCLLTTGKYGCCPLPQAVCCSDHIHCCPHDYTCSVEQQGCVLGNQVVPWTMKTPAIPAPISQAQPVVTKALTADERKEVLCPGGHFYCPSRTTCCKLESGAYGCCPMPEAVCCPDHEHCCPRDYTCSVTNSTCTKEAITNRWILVRPARSLTPQQVTVCGKGFASCPGLRSCCKMEGDIFGCCPYAGGICCDDKKSCCPYGFSCNYAAGKCVKAGSSFTIPIGHPTPADSREPQPDDEGETFLHSMVYFLIDSLISDTEDEGDMNFSQKLKNQFSSKSKKKKKKVAKTKTTQTVMIQSGPPKGKSISGVKKDNQPKLSVGSSSNSNIPAKKKDLKPAQVTTPSQTAPVDHVTLKATKKEETVHTKPVISTCTTKQSATHDESSVPINAKSTPVSVKVESQNNQDKILRSDNDKLAKQKKTTEFEKSVDKRSNEPPDTQSAVRPPEQLPPKVIGQMGVKRVTEPKTSTSIDQRHKKSLLDIPIHSVKKPPIKVVRKPPPKPPQAKKSQNIKKPEVPKIQSKPIIKNAGVIKPLIKNVQKTPVQKKPKPNVVPAQNHPKIQQSNKKPDFKKTVSPKVIAQTKKVKTVAPLNNNKKTDPAVRKPVATPVKVSISKSSSVSSSQQTSTQPTPTLVKPRVIPTQSASLPVSQQEQNSPDSATKPKPLNPTLNSIDPTHTSSSKTKSSTSTKKAPPRRPPVVKLTGDVNLSKRLLKKSQESRADSTIEDTSQDHKSKSVATPTKSDKVEDLKSSDRLDNLEGPIINCSCPNATCCELPSKKYGCCPMKEAVCCADKLHCCPHGTTCDPQQGTCTLSGMSIPQQPRLLTTQAVSTGITCPDKKSTCAKGTTCCQMLSGYYGCCPHEKAVCCSDKLHCCPHGSTCDVEKGTCISSGTSIPQQPKLLTTQSVSTDITCPDKKSTCPSDTTCCQMLSGWYGCCPHEKAVCCADRLHCCPNGEHCNSTTGECLKMTQQLSSAPEQVDRVLPQQAAVVLCGDNVTHCPDDSTCCLLENQSYGCCPMVQAVCCSDHIHCCPHGTKCNTQKQTCDATLELLDLESPSTTLIFGKANKVQCDSTYSCPDGSTCCKLASGQWGCCPVPQAVCCADHVHCCPQGTKCNTQKQKCDSTVQLLDLESPSTTLIVSKASSVQCDSTYSCPDGSTCCKLASGQWGCCPTPKAICCADHVHCCPHGYKCDVGRGTCEQSLHSVPWLTKQPAMQRDVTPNSVECPDGSSHCPDHTTCCLLVSGQYGCCQLPDAVCCTDGLHCCPHGYKCDAVHSACVKGVEALLRQQAPSDNSIICPDKKSQCSTQDTCCKQKDGTYLCCPLPQGTCCKDGAHCCPHGLHCDDTGTRCVAAAAELSPSATQIQSVSSNLLLDAMSPSTKVKCKDGTECADSTTCCPVGKDHYNCCPFPDAVCCPGSHCCPAGFACDPSSGTCTQITRRRMPWVASEQPASAGQIAVICPDRVHECPDHNTCCPLQSGSWGCCPLPQAVCCKDGLHCCPAGYKCSLTSDGCVKDSKNDSFPAISVLQP